jgi:hypothetical protein
VITRKEYPNGSKGVYKSDELVRIEKCPCEDGIARAVYNLYTPREEGIPGIVRVKSKSVSGLVVLTEYGYVFRANKNSKNARVLEW